MIHHLNCGSFHPAIVGAMVSHCLLIERPDGLTLVDAGFGTEDIANSKRLGRPFKALMRPLLRLEETALAQVQALGYAATDVTDIVLTHLDIDHVGGVGDFPHAKVHVHESELEAARSPRGMEHGRYLPVQWQDATLVTHATGGDDWLGFDSVGVLSDDVLLVPLAGHSRGHAGVAVRRPDGRWLLHAGDAYFHTGDRTTPPSTPRTLKFTQKVLAQDNETRLTNQERLRELIDANPEDLQVFCAHDASELKALQDQA